LQDQSSKGSSKSLIGIKSVKHEPLKALIPCGPPRSLEAGVTVIGGHNTTRYHPGGVMGRCLPAWADLMIG
jgi:hypothetical protein